MPPLCSEIGEGRRASEALPERKATAHVLLGEWMLGRSGMLGCWQLYRASLLSTEDSRQTRLGMQLMQRTITGPEKVKG